MISQREELRNEEEDIQQNGVDGEPTIILKENVSHSNVSNIHNTNELNNADTAIEGEHIDPPHNIIPPEENATEQPNDINENKLLKIKEIFVNAYAESIVTPFDEIFNLRKSGRNKQQKNFGKN